MQGGRELPQELVRLLGSLERLPLAVKQSLAKKLLAGFTRFKHREPYAWALGRLLARVPLYAGPDSILPPSEVEKAYRELAALDWRQSDYSALVPLFVQAARRTDQRDLDIPPALRESLLAKFKESVARPEQLRVVRDCIPIEEADRVAQFGESLPVGLFLVTGG
jgi:hypothetical protein